MGPVEPTAVEPDTGKHTRGPGPGWHGFWQRGANHSGFQPDESGDLDGQRYANHSGGATGPGLARGRGCAITRKTGEYGLDPGQ